MNKDNFCSFPFTTIFLGADGDVKPCCSAVDSFGNINNQDINDILNGPIATEVREYIVNDKWHPLCNQCQRLEKMGARTERTGTLYQYEELKNSTKDTLILRKIDLRWSNTCNLSCNYCYEYFSSQWASIKGISVNANKKTAEEKVFNFLKEHKDTLESINLLGGEPLLQKQNKRLIEILPDKNYYILTNMSVDVKNNEIANMLLSNERVEWGISFETICERFEYVRHGAIWDTFLRNLKYVKSKNPAMINAHPLYCTYSALNLKEYYRFITESKIFNDVYWCAIQNLDGLNIFNMSQKFREAAIFEIETVSKEFKGASGLEHLQEIKKNLENSLDTIPKINGGKHFINWTKDIEQKYLNKEHTAKILWPEVYKLL